MGHNAAKSAPAADSHTRHSHAEKKKKQKRFKEHLKPNGVCTMRRLNKFRLARRIGKINCGTLWIIEMIPGAVRRVDIISSDGTLGIQNGLNMHFLEKERQGQRNRKKK